MQVVQNSKGKGEETTEMMLHSVEFIAKIISASDDINNTSLQISTSVQEQSNVTASLDVNINGIVSSGQESNQLINQIKVKANQLDDHVNNLQLLTNQFEV